MANVLPRLRRDLDIMPSPVPGQPGLLIRDPFRYSESMIVVPPVLAQGLTLFDGERTDLDLHEFLTRLTGDLTIGDVGRSLTKTLRECGFLESEEFHELRDRKQREFAGSDERSAAHAGSAYPAEADPLREKLRQYGADPDPALQGKDSLVAIAAPHVSPEGGFQSYAAAYRRINATYAESTFVILGTSHYGRPERFGLTRKPYVTPLGRCEPDLPLIDWLTAQAPNSIVMEDYCHRTEHSIEFQCVFLQYAVGKPDVKIVPILCGPFAESLQTGRAPEKDDHVRRFLEALGEMAQKHRDRLIWVLGIDLAHIGRRYGDSFPATAGQGLMEEIRERDEARLERICAGDADGFFDLVLPNQDDLRWCGYSPVYAFVRAITGVQGKVLNYEQWNIDEQSVVSFAGVQFTAAH